MMTFLVTFLLVTTILSLYRLHRRCDHQWDSWSGWSARNINYYHTVFHAMRTCNKCGKLQETEVFEHYCTKEHCPHLKDFRKAAYGIDRIKDLEKELGI